LAINPDTGDIEWYFQHIPAETHDLDEVFEIVVVDRGDRRALYKMGKIGVMWELDPKTGAYLNSWDLGYQDIVDIDENGQGILRRERIPQLNVPVDYCPGPGGLKNLWAMAYHPETDAFYIPLTPGCAHSVFKPMEDPPAIGGGGVGPADRQFTAHPKSPDQLGNFVAMHSRTGEVLWSRPSRLQYGTSALTTGGGLVFVGNIDRHVYALDARNGGVLWQTRTPTATDGFPITYAIDGRQYLAVPSGPGWFLSWNNAQQVFSDIRRPRTRGSVMHVFALPEQ
jgi:alcohol dehydrogenase (cytochrome c)